MSFMISSILFIFRTTVFASAVLFAVKWEHEKQRTADLVKQRDLAQQQQAAAERMAEARVQEAHKDMQLQRDVLMAVLEEIKQSREHTDKKLKLVENN